jgi:hypothetical protein
MSEETSQANGADHSAPLEPNIQAMNAMLHALFPPSKLSGFDDAKIELAYNSDPEGGPDRAEAFSVFKPQELVARAVELNRRGKNLYIGPALRRPEWRGGRSRKEDVWTTFNLWADHDDEHGDANLSSGAEAFDIDPAFLTTTGTQPHPRRQTFFPVEGDITPEKIEAGNRALQAIFKSDPLVIEPGRLMRLAGSNTFPKADKRKRGYINEGTSFSIVPRGKTRDIDAIIALKSSPGNGAAGATNDDLGGDESGALTPEQLLELLKKAREPGHWNNSIFRVTGSLVGYDLNDFAIKMICAQSCEGGFGDAELDAMLQRTRIKFGRPDPASFTAAPMPTERPWPVLDRTALYGVIGDIVKLIEPHTEADPAGILFTLMAQCGNLIGPLPYYKVDIASQLRLNMFVMLVGKTAKARKGTVGELVKFILRGIDDEWTTTRQLSGLSTGEGIIHAMRDEEKKWNKELQDFEIIDPGISDKRLMITESEFARPLMAMERSGNTLSPIIRDAWDCSTLRTATRSNGQTATNPFVSIVAHITEAELSKRMTQTELANGFANRFMFCSTRRSKMLAFSDEVDDEALAALGVRLREAIVYAKRIGRVKMTSAAADMWRQIYPVISEDRPGLLGNVLARAEAHVLKVSTLFTALDMKGAIDEQHLEGALAAWAYSEASSKYIFGTASGDALADEILRALLHRGKLGLTRTEIRDMFLRNVSSGRVNTALELLQKTQQARCDISHPERGRPVEKWYATEA